MASADREALPTRPRPQRLLPPCPARRGRWDLRGSRDATEPQVRKALPDLRGHRDRRALPGFPAPKENLDRMVLRGRLVLSGRKVPLALLVLPAAQRHARQRRDNPDLPARLGLKDHPGLRVPRVRKAWRDIRARRGLKALRDREGSWGRPALRVLADLLDLLAPPVRWVWPGLPDRKALPVRSAPLDLRVRSDQSALLA